MTRQRSELAQLGQVVRNISEFDLELLYAVRGTIEFIVHLLYLPLIENILGSVWNSVEKFLKLKWISFSKNLVFLSFIFKSAFRVFWPFRVKKLKNYLKIFFTEKANFLNIKNIF